MATTKESEMTVEIFPISDTEHTEVILRGEDYHAIHVQNGATINERSAYGSGERGLRFATNAARQWAFGIRYDRQRLPR